MSEKTLHVDRRLVATLGAAWILTLAGLLLDRPPFILLGLVLGGVAAFGISPPSRAGIRASHEVSVSTPTEGESLRILGVVRNEDRRSYLAEWKLDLPDVAEVEEGTSAGYTVLPGGGEWAHSLEVEMMLFGLHEVGPTKLRIGDAFGFAWVENEAGSPVDLRVYPKREALKKPVADADQKRSLIGRYEVSQPGQGFEFFGLREYRHGDKPGDINWKASARSGDLIVNQHERETNAKVILFVDVRSDTGVGRLLESPFAQGCRAALSLAETHLRARDDARFIAYGAEVREDRHTGAHRRLQGILDVVMELAPRGDLPLEEVLDRYLARLTPRSPVFIVSPLVGDDTLEDAVVRLLSHEFPVTVLVPQPDWGGGSPTEEQIRWETEQDLAVRRLRRRGARVARLEKDVPLYDLLRRMEVIG